MNKTYQNISEYWGDFVTVTVDDYRAQAVRFGSNAEIEEREDGIYIDGEKVAEVSGATKGGGN